jgi:hypothetical protein
MVSSSKIAPDGHREGGGGQMCRSIVRLREGTTLAPREAAEQAALQYVRKVSGFRNPSAANRAVFEAAVEEIAEATTRLLESLVIGGRTTR